MKNTALQFRNISAKNALRSAVMVLQQARIETASLDARLLLEYVLGVTREQLLMGNKLSLNFSQEALYHDLVEKRMRRQPVSQLIEKREFWGRNFKVTAATLDPRPDSETLIESVLARADKDAPLRLLDLGTGTGCLLLTLLAELPNASGVGVDICTDALLVARENAGNLKLENRAHFIQSRWNEQVEGTFDIVISNPPYIPTGGIASLAPEVGTYEPKLALDGGLDGMDCYRQILPQLQNLLAPNGMAFFEIGAGQQKDFETIAVAQGLRVMAVKEDMAGHPRCITLQHEQKTKQG